MTKQEQIEEMAKERNEIKDIMKLLDKCVSLNPMYKSEVASVLYGNNYRKLPEDSVVLSKEEYEMLKSLYDTQKGAIMTSSVGDLPSQKQIAEMEEIIKAEYKQWLDIAGVIPEGTTYYAECMGCAIDSAEALYNAGYRKTFTNEMVSDTQKAYKEGYEKAQSELKTEIERLKAENEELTKVVSSKVYDLIDNTKEIADAREAWEKQAKIDVLNELTVKAVSLSAIETYHICNLVDELLKEYE